MELLVLLVMVVLAQGVLGLAVLALVVLGLVRLTRWAPSEAHLGGILVYCSAATSPNLAFWTSLVGLLGNY